MITWLAYNFADWQIYVGLRPLAYPPPKTYENSSNYACCSVNGLFTIVFKVWVRAGSDISLNI